MSGDGMFELRVADERGMFPEAGAMPIDEEHTRNLILDCIASSHWRVVVGLYWVDLKPVSLTTTLRTMRILGRRR